MKVDNRWAVHMCCTWNPKYLLITFRELMSEDILHRLNNMESNNPPIEDVHNQALITIGDLFLSICNKALTQFTIFAPNRSNKGIFDCEIQKECDYKIDEILNKIIFQNWFKCNCKWTNYGFNWKTKRWTIFLSWSWRVKRF